MTTDVINGVPRDEFQREERYVVVKIRKMHPHPEFRRRHLEALKAENIAALVDCVVVEKDWPEYETVWKMIEARVSGATAQPADHSEHALNMAAQPAADGEREAFEAVYAGRCNFERNPHHPDIYANEPCRARWEAWQARAAQPQQAVAVTDEVNPDTSRLDFLESHPNWLRAHKGRWSCKVPFTNYSYPVFKTAREAIDAALAAHKTGEEE